MKTTINEVIETTKEELTNINATVLPSGTTITVDQVFFDDILNSFNRNTKEYIRNMKIELDRMSMKPSDQKLEEFINKHYVRMNTIKKYEEQKPKESIYLEK